MIKKNIFNNFLTLLIPLLKNFVPLEKALLVIEQMRNTDNKIKMLSSMLRMSIHNGYSLAYALTQNNIIKISENDIAAIIMAEKCGNLVQVLENIYLLENRKNENKKTIVSLCIYPCVIIFVMFIGSMLLIGFGKNIGFNFCKNEIMSIVQSFLIILFVCFVILFKCKSLIADDFNYSFFFHCSFISKMDLIYIMPFLQL